jgi:hypothetical protein
VPALPAAGAAAEYQKRQVPKEAGVHAFLVQALQGNMFFGALNASELGDVVGAMECEHLAAALTAALRLGLTLALSLALTLGGVCIVVSQRRPTR